MIIYKITNKTNKKSYIGQTVKILKIRWNEHCQKRGGCTALYSAIKKYGKDNFDLEVITECKSIDEMNLRETFYIKLFNTLAHNGYNLTTGGNNFTMLLGSRKGTKNSFYGKKHSEETKKKMSILRIGKYIGENNPSARLTNQQVELIRELYEMKENNKRYYSTQHLSGLARVSYSQIYRIVNYKSFVIC